MPPSGSSDRGWNHFGAPIWPPRLPNGPKWCQKRPQSFQNVSETNKKTKNSTSKITCIRTQHAQILYIQCKDSFPEQHFNCLHIRFLDSLYDSISAKLFVLLHVQASELISPSGGPCSKKVSLLGRVLMIINIPGKLKILFLSLPYLPSIPGFGFLGLDSQIWIPGFGSMGLDSWVWIPGLGFLG